MPAGKMHADEVDTDAALVRRLLAAQFPRWADLPIAPVPSAGTDNALYRLGDDYVVRLPRILRAAETMEKEVEWVPRLAPLLPLPVSVPLAQGTPSDGFPWLWTVCPWLDGETATTTRDADSRQLARDLAGFIAALWHIDPTDGPPPGPHNFYRGCPLALRDASTREAIAALDGLLDTAKATAAWDRTPVWLHGDLQAGNLLVQRGRLNAVIDFGGLGVGDPACDVMVAWSFFTADARAAFRAALAVDDATWARGRGWALSFGLIALPYYLHTNPTLAAIARHTIAEALAE